MIEKAKSAENELALLRTKEEVKTACSSIEELKDETAKKKACIEELAMERGTLEKTVVNLNSAVNSYTVLEGELRNRILAS